MLEGHTDHPEYIVVEGPIGVGKTTLVNQFSEHYKAHTVLEVFEENPFLADFYDDTEEYAFQTEMFFLLSRYRQQEEFAQTDLFSQLSVSDYLFVKSRLFASLTLSDHELTLYDRMYDILTEQVPTPDAVVHLHAPLETLLDRIEQRGRPYEQEIEPAYLERLRSLYHNFFDHYDEAPLVEVDTTQVDFSQDDEAVQDLMDRICRVYREAKSAPTTIEFDGRPQQRD
ncbi:MAG: deoxynucleoside kinase [Bradymonadaceae bacterium]